MAEVRSDGESICKQGKNVDISITDRTGLQLSNLLCYRKK